MIFKRFYIQILLSILTTSCTTTVNITGKYYKSMEWTAYELIFKSDSTFQYINYTKPSYVYSEGVWSYRKKYIILNSKPRIDTSGYGPKGIWVLARDTEKLFIQDTFLFLHNKIIFRDKDFKDKKIIMKKRR